MVYATILIFCNSLYTSNSHANELIIEKKQGFLSKFEDINSNDVTLNDFNGKLLLINLWATWCEPCKEEMPSLQNLQNNSKFKNLKILPINIGQEDKNSIKKFFSDVSLNKSINLNELSLSSSKLSLKLMFFDQIFEFVV